MTDGPFKNLQLSAQLKKIVKTLGNDAYGDDERGSRICGAVVKNLADAGDLDLVAKLEALAGQQQMDLDPLSSVEEVFRNHPQSPFADKLQQELTYAMAHDAGLEDGLQQALPGAVGREIQECNNRIQEELVRACEAGEARRDQVDDAMQDLRRASDAAPLEDACAAIRSGNKNAFKVTASKKVDAEEGPSL